MTIRKATKLLELQTRVLEDKINNIKSHPTENNELIIEIRDMLSESFERQLIITKAILAEINEPEKIKALPLEHRIQMRRNKVNELDQKGMKVKQIAKKLGYAISTIEKDLHYLRTKS